MSPMTITIIALFRRHLAKILKCQNYCTHNYNLITVDNFQDDMWNQGIVADNPLPKEMRQNEGPYDNYSLTPTPIRTMRLWHFMVQGHHWTPRGKRSNSWSYNSVRIRSRKSSCTQKTFKSSYVSIKDQPQPPIEFRSLRLSSQLSNFVIAWYEIFRKFS